MRAYNKLACVEQRAAKVPREAWLGLVVALGYEVGSAYFVAVYLDFLLFGIVPSITTANSSTKGGKYENSSPV